VYPGWVSCVPKLGVLCTWAESRVSCVTKPVEHGCIEPFQVDSHAVGS
jgi:hypothetical protein